MWGEPTAMMHYHTGAEGFVLVVDSNGSPPHLPDHEPPHASEPKCQALPRAPAREVHARARTHEVRIAAANQGTSTAAPRNFPSLTRDNASLAALNGKVSTLVFTGTFGASARNSSPSRRVRLATEQIVRSPQINW